MRVGKMSMGVSLEGRCPFSIIGWWRLAMSIPPEINANGQLKAVLKRAVKTCCRRDHSPSQAGWSRFAGGSWGASANGRVSNSPEFCARPTTEFRKSKPDCDRTERLSISESRLMVEKSVAPLHTRLDLRRLSSTYETSIDSPGCAVVEEVAHDQARLSTGSLQRSAFRSAPRRQPGNSGLPL